MNPPRPAREIRARELTEPDAQFVVEVCTLAHCRPFVLAPTIDQVRSSVGAPGAVTYIFEAQERKVGIARLAFMGEPLWLVELRLIAMAEPGTGYGTAALAWIAREVFETRRAHRLYLEVAAANARARGLYERCGYVQEGIWREGFRSSEGVYDDLVAYAMLEREYAERR